VTDRVIVDAGPIVALFDRREEFHEWAIDEFARHPMPLITCEAVVVEAAYLMRAWPGAQDKLLEWLGNGTLAVDFDLAEDAAAIRRLMRKYRDRPMSLADACLVRMAEVRPDHAICTLDADFRVYRRDGGGEIRLLIPGAA
jgi:predicted nucleic acid-binding protein